MIQLVITDAEQPHHIRVTSTGNHHTLVIGENLINAGDVMNGICAIAEEFGFKDANVWEEGGYYALRDGDEVKAQIFLVDERTEEVTNDGA